MPSISQPDNAPAYDRVGSNAKANLVNNGEKTPIARIWIRPFNSSPSTLMHICIVALSRFGVGLSIAGLPWRVLWSGPATAVARLSPRRLLPTGALPRSDLGPYQDAVADLKVRLWNWRKRLETAHLTTELERLIQKFEQEVKVDAYLHSLPDRHDINNNMAGFLRFALPLIAFLSIFPLYTRYKAAAAAPIPPGVHLANLELSHLKDPAQIEAAIVASLGQPIAVYYDRDAPGAAPRRRWTLRSTRRRCWRRRSSTWTGQDFVDIALRKLAGIPQRRRDIAARYSFDAQKLATWLMQVGEELDHPPQPGRVLPPQWNVAGGARRK